MTIMFVSLVGNFHIKRVDDLGLVSACVRVCVCKCVSVFIYLGISQFVFLFCFFDCSCIYLCWIEGQLGMFRNSSSIS